MKKILIPCMFVISFLTATAAQLPTNILNSTNDTIITEAAKTPSYEIIEILEEEDVAFDFDINNYLPIGFDPYISFEEKYGIQYEIVLEEVDTPFDFDTTSYLPVGFYLKKSILNSIEEIKIEGEEDEPFDYDTKMYLPKGFDAFDKDVKSVEI